MKQNTTLSDGVQGMLRLKTIIATCMLTCSLSAGNVTPEQALQKASQFMQQQRQARGAMRAPDAAPQLTPAGLVSGLYLFNAADGQGFVIVSPDDRTEAILGFSDSGHIDSTNIPDNMRQWLQCYADEVKAMDDDWTSAPDISSARATTSRQNITPLVKAHWDQGYKNMGQPFANSLPTIGGEQCFTGCVATAMAQVMYKHKYPSATTAEIPAYTTSTNHLSMSRIPAGTKINWSQMLDTYGYWNDGTNYGTNTSHNSTQDKAVADLMLYCGSSVKADYGTSSTSAPASNCDIALVKYFGYDKMTTQLVVKSDYTSSQWDEIMYTELKGGRPVIYSGSGNGSHSFVLDGYRTDGYYHVNWGWATTGYDGYYRLTALTPGSHNYSSDNYATIGIQPTGGGGNVSSDVFSISAESLRLIDAKFSQNPVRPGAMLTLTLTVQNMSANAYNNELGIMNWGSGGYYYPSTYQSAGTQKFTSGQVKEISYTIKAPDSVGEQMYVFWGLKNGNQWMLVQVLTEKLVTSNSAPATGIDNITTSADETEAAYFDLSGRRVQNPTKGIYIVNGKKVLF